MALLKKLGLLWTWASLVFILWGVSEISLLAQPSANGPVNSSGLDAEIFSTLQSSEESLDVEEFLNEGTGSMPDINKDFLNLNEGSPTATTEGGATTNSATQTPAAGLAKTDDFGVPAPAPSESSDDLKVENGLPGRTSQSPQAEPTAPLTNRRIRSDIPVEAFGEDGYGNPYIPSNLYSGAGVYGEDCGQCDCDAYYSSLEDLRFYSNDWNFRDKSFRLGQFYADGWVSAGGSNENQWPITPALGTGADGEINDEGADFGVNQLYLSFGREVIRGGCWDIGANVDLLYGTDYLWASSIGLESRTTGIDGAHASRIANAEARWNVNDKGGYKRYGLAMPQLYGEVYAPFLSGLDLKFGHFYAPMGHESVQSTKNFFYTHSYSFAYGQPHTFTGMLGDLKIGRGLSLQAGFSQGWDTWDDNKGSLDVLGGLVFQFSPLSSLSFFLTSGDAIVDNEFDPETNEFLRYMTGKQTSYSMVYQRKLGGCWSWALEHDFGSAQNAAATLDAEGNLNYESGNWYSLVNYLYYQVQPNMTLGLRFEWFKDRNYTRVIGDYAVNEQAPDKYKWDGDNFYDFSLGLNWQVLQHVTLRPEVRYDFSDVKMTSLDGETNYADGVYDNFTDSKMWTVGADVLVEF